MLEAGIVIIFFVLSVLALGLYISFNIKSERTKWNLMMKDYHEEMDNARKRAYYIADKQFTDY